MATKVCEVCGKTFASNYGWAKYCSEECGKIGKAKTNAALYRDKKAGKKKARICPMCGAVVARRGQSKYCSAKCAYKADLARQAEKRRNSAGRKKATLCWSCQNACCGCSWSRSFTPVEGWQAKQHKLKIYKKDGDEEWDVGYFVISCPQYIPDEPRGAKK